MPADLAADTAVRADPDAPGRYRVAMPDHWDYLLPSGGALVTAALRAGEAALGEPALRLASSTAVFCAPLHPGPLVADVTILRRGGATAQVRIALRHATAIARVGEGDRAVGHEGLEVTATFCRDRRGPDVVGVAPPAVRALADALPTDDDAPSNPHRRFRFYQQLECRVADGERFWSGFEAGPARYARWLRYRVPQRDAAGRFDRLAIPPLVDIMPTALHRAIGPGPYRFYAPSLDLTTYVVDDTAREWLLVATTLRRARAGWAIADAEVWDEDGRLVAHAAQAMYLQSLAGEPPVVDASRR